MAEFKDIAGTSDPANLPVLRGPLATCRTIRSIKQREPGILVHVRPVLARIAEASQLQLPRPGPDEQPNESSQLARDARACASSCLRFILQAL